MNVRPLLIFLSAAVTLLAPVASADAATRTTYPSISKIAPMNVAIGETMTVYGKGFVPGKNKNTVVFKRDNQRAIFAKAVSATSAKLRVVVPEKVRPFLGKKDGADVPTKFRIRVLARRFGKRYTTLTSSPTIAPSPSAPVGAAPVAPAAQGPAPDCDGDTLADAADDDDDNDHLKDSKEAEIKTNPCQVDTDGDGLSDYWEFKSALDLNRRAIPYPAKRPYPNPLFGDQNVDYDGDGMLAWQEHAMWVRYGNTGAEDLSYSDGNQRSDKDDERTDDRRDIDEDGLPNHVEANGEMQREWWKEFYPDEILYPVVYADPDFLDWDSDGDGVADGVDDLDHDGVWNRNDYDREQPQLDQFDTPNSEMPRWVQPHNPCLPNPRSITCSLYIPPIDKAWAPFKELSMGPAQLRDPELDLPLPLPYPFFILPEEPATP